MRTIAAGGFKDITRIASSSPVMWQNICLSNQEQILKLTDCYIHALQNIRSSVADAKSDDIISFFQSAKDYRDSITTPVRGSLQKNYSVYCDLVDEAGAIATLATIMASHNISIKNIGILHNREYEDGVLQIEFYEEDALEKAVKLMEERQEHYKIEHMADLADETEFSFFQQGEYVDMCIGPHLTYTKALKAFKITQQSGAYWKNDKENKMLTRINGVAFHNQEELEAWEKEQQEARERDHRKIGKEMGLFMTDDLVGRGLPMFLPNGYIIWQQLEDYIKGKERERGYLHVMTPCIGTVNLYKTSGHWDHYRENMFPAMEMEGESYVLRPMNCPHHMMIYANRPHSYRDLPMRIGEIAHDFRYESSGTLKGIERGRHFCQNDAHLFCTPEQIKSEVADVCNLIFETYKDFNITDYRCVLSLRDPADKKKYHDDDAMWNHAENALREVLTELGIHFTEEIGEAAFYGPKLDVNVKPAVGAEYTLSTCQLDFCLPAKFHLTYVDKDGTEKTPVVLHRAILGSLDRFMAYLIEETKGKFPTWLAPVQVKVLPVSEKTLEYAEAITEKLVEAGVRVALDDDNQKIGYKIRAAQQVDRVPYMLVLGAKEAEAGNVSVRDRKGETTTMEVDEFIAKVTAEIKNRSL